MIQNQLFSLLDQTRQDEKHLSRFFLFAGASSIDHSTYIALRQAILERLHLEEPAFVRLMAQTSEDWRWRIEHMNELILHSPLINRFEKRARSCQSSSGVSMMQAKSALARLLCLSLQKLSIQTGENHLKPHDWQRLMRHLESPQHLKNQFERIEKPFRRALKGSCSPTESLFLHHSLLCCQLLADYEQTILEQGQGAKSTVLQEWLEQADKWSLQDIQLFFHPPFLAASLLSAPRVESVLEEDGDDLIQT